PEKGRHRRLAQSFERRDRRRYLHWRDDGLLRTTDELARGTKQRPPDRLGIIRTKRQTSGTGHRPRIGEGMVAGRGEKPQRQPWGISLSEDVLVRLVRKLPFESARKTSRFAPVP